MALLVRRGIEALGRAVLAMPLAQFAKQTERADAADGSPPHVPEAAVAAAKATIRSGSKGLAAKIQRHSQGEFKRLGIDLRKTEPSFARQIDAWRKVNVDRVGSLLEFERDELADILSKGWGKTVPELRERIEERLEVSRNKADLLARDQVLTLNAQISHGRMQAAGITHAIWCSSKDERTRPSHAEADGQEFEIAEGLLVDDEKVLPGDPILCRCVSCPILPELEDD
jgi:SPP1 gp7 family putative phage head morphogenesis protein